MVDSSKHIQVSQQKIVLRRIFLWWAFESCDSAVVTQHRTVQTRSRLLKSTGLVVRDTDEEYIIDVFSLINSSFPSTPSLMDTARERRALKWLLDFTQYCVGYAKIHDVASYL